MLAVQVLASPTSWQDVLILAIQMLQTVSLAYLAIDRVSERRASDLRHIEDMKVASDLVAGLPSDKLPARKTKSKAARED
jgi:hypothetical protein